MPVYSDAAVEKLVIKQTAINTIDEAARAFDLLPSAIDELTDPLFPHIQRFLDSGFTASQFIERTIEARPDMKPRVFEPDDIEKAHKLFQTVTGRGKYRAEFGQDAYDAMATKLGVDPNPTKLSLPPLPKQREIDIATGKPKVKPHSTNPWADGYWPPQNAEAERLRIIKTSTRMAADLARSAGKTISSQPLRK